MFNYQLGLCINLCSNGSIYLATALPPTQRVRTWGKQVVQMAQRAVPRFENLKPERS